MPLLVAARAAAVTIVPHHAVVDDARRLGLGDVNRRQGQWSRRLPSHRGRQTPVNTTNDNRFGRAFVRRGQECRWTHPSHGQFPITIFPSRMQQNVRSHAVSVARGKAARVPAVRESVSFICSALLPCGAVGAVTVAVLVGKAGSLSVKTGDDAFPTLPRHASSWCVICGRCSWQTVVTELESGESTRCVSWNCLRGVELWSCATRS